MGLYFFSTKVFLSHRSKPYYFLVTCSKYYISCPRLLIATALTIVVMASRSARRCSSLSKDFDLSFHIPASGTDFDAPASPALPPRKEGISASLPRRSAGPTGTAAAVPWR